MTSRTKGVKSPKKAKKKNIGFSADAELRAKIDQYMIDNGFGTVSATVRYLVLDSLRRDVNFSNIQSEIAKQ